MTQFKYKYTLEDIELSGDTVDKIFIFEEKIKLTGNYADEICDKLSDIFKCTFKPLSYNLCKNNITFYVGCVNNDNKRFKLICIKSDIKKSENIKIKVSTNKRKPCDHRDNLIVRNIKGSAREALKHQLVNQRPKKVN